MRSALLPRRKASNVDLLAAALAMFVVTFSLGMLVGYLWGSAPEPKAYRCPTIQGLKATSTYDGKDGQRCVFVRETYGAAKVVVKL